MLNQQLTLLVQRSYKLDTATIEPKVAGMGVLLQARQTLTADEQKVLQESDKATARRHHMTFVTFTPDEIALTELALEERERALEEGGQACSKDKASCDASILIMSCTRVLPGLQKLLGNDRLQLM